MSTTPPWEKPTYYWRYRVIAAKDGKRYHWAKPGKSGTLVALLGEPKRNRQGHVYDCAIICEHMKLRSWPILRDGWWPGILMCSLWNGVAGYQRCQWCMNAGDVGVDARLISLRVSFRPKYRCCTKGVARPFHFELFMSDCRFCVQKQQCFVEKARHLIGGDVDGGQGTSG